MKLNDEQIILIRKKKVNIKQHECRGSLHYSFS
jgi:uncharacterized beta-barrel protein YwiB (DUF1934 family)